MVLPRGASRLCSWRTYQVGIVPLRPSTTSRVTTLTCRRSFHVEGVMLAPVLFGGLFVSLWTWKCFMMVVFQNKIIYMPGLPPNARWETISDYAHRCSGIKWREERTRASDGTDLALCVADLKLGRRSDPAQPAIALYILYFQGNAASIPLRLPDLSSTLRLMEKNMAHDSQRIQLTMVCLSYRGYWTSRGRPNEKGIRLDALAACDWIAKHHRDSCDAGEDLTSTAQLVLWGQSIGSGIATNLAADCPVLGNIRINSLVLETPFTSVRAMLEVLYPQKWLPYKYLWPFLRSHLDSWENIRTIAEKHRKLGSKPEVLILQAAKDELVPSELSDKLYARCIETDLPAVKRAVDGAFHNDVMFRGEGKKTVSAFVLRRITSTDTNA
ncbi:Alpha/Beta hydrolase protein [Xylariaceae sp. FL0016]|nr:Alpha/Beta hydrolase protein [Xylariaceae sp. FL0016]